LFSIGFRESISELRTAWKAINSKDSAGRTDEMTAPISARISSSIQDTCCEAAGYIKDRIQPTCTTPDQRVYFEKLLGDFDRYRAEVLSGHPRDEAAVSALKHYTAAADASICNLPSTDPVRLGLMLNFSIYYYEIMHNPERACIIAKAACDDAIEGNLFFRGPCESAKPTVEQSRHIFGLIRANLIKWSSQLVPKAIQS
jgi:14-3-3 protein epsilon